MCTCVQLYAPIYTHLRTYALINSIYTYIHQINSFFLSSFLSLFLPFLPYFLSSLYKLHCRCTQKSQVSRMLETVWHVCTFHQVRPRFAFSCCETLIFPYVNWIPFVLRHHIVPGLKIFWKSRPPPRHLPSISCSLWWIQRVAFPSALLHLAYIGSSCSLGSSTLSQVGSNGHLSSRCAGAVRQPD